MIDWLTSEEIGNECHRELRSGKYNLLPLAEIKARLSNEMLGFRVMILYLLISSPEKLYWCTSKSSERTQEEIYERVRRIYVPSFSYTLTQFYHYWSIHTFIHTLLYLPSDIRVVYAANISEHNLTHPWPRLKTAGFLFYLVIKEKTIKGP